MSRSRPGANLNTWRLADGVGRPTMYPIYQFLHILIRCTLLVIVQCQASESLDFCFNSTLEGFRLDATVLKTKGVSQLMECIVEFVNEPCCRSINYKKDFQNTEANCEMLHDVVYNTSEKVLERNSSYDYVYLLDPQKV
ncbi:Hypothetical predicted protein [Paramuricea clavata]|uniref:Uncharacterized protein n=1 Tax=Paramuricea clavata TaxID=317549 RepID=A0A7D9HPA0_PARCT|nr:Hypothetical predicted protein [Paramuricea clavata]